MSIHQDNAAAYRRYQAAPEHVAVMDLAEDLLLRLEQLDPSSTELAGARDQATEQVKRLMSQLQEPEMVPHSHSPTPSPRFDGEHLGLDGLYRVASELLELHLASPLFSELSFDAEWKAQLVEDNLADYSPALHMQMRERVAEASDIPASNLDAYLMGVYVYSHYLSGRQAPGWSVDRLANIQADLARFTGGDAIEAPSHWEKFDPSKVRIETHSRSVTQKAQSLYYGDPNVDGDEICLGRFGADAEISALQGSVGGGYRVTPKARDTYKSVHQMFHNGHHGVGLAPLVRTSEDVLREKLREGFQKARSNPRYADDVRIKSLEDCFLAGLGEGPHNGQAIENGELAR